MHSPIPISPIPVAVIGLGRAGWNIHFNPIRANAGFKIVAVADPATERGEEARELTGCQVFSSLADVLNESEAELVVIATPSARHFEDTWKVLNSGRHCFVEKPMALNADEASKLIGLARSRSLHLFVNHTQLFMPDYHHLKAAIDRGVLGPIYHLRTFWGGYRRRWDWQTLKKNGGGELNNTCSHVLSAVLPLLGSPVTSVAADLRNIKNAGDAEDHVQLLLRTESGVTADVTVSTAYAGAGVPRWILAGKYGALTCDGKKSTLRYYDPTKVPAITAVDGAAQNRAYGQETLPWIEETLPVEDPNLGSPYQNVHDVLKGVGQPVVTPESAAEVIRVMDLAVRSKW